jgi:DNA polymerase III epsilon subunit-like protein
MKTYTGLPHLYGHVLAAIDFETTGLRPGYNEIIQIAVVPLGSDFTPHPDMRPFYTLIAPDAPERASATCRQKHGINVEGLVGNAPTADKVRDLLTEWFTDLDLPIDKKLVPLAHNWAFEAMFLMHWLGPQLKDHIFHACARDTMLMATSINDRAAYIGEEPPFNRVNLGHLCEKLNVTNENPHDALADCLATALVYRELLQLDII